MATLDDDLANAVTEGFRLAQSSIINQDLILSGTGDVTVTLANGSKKTGPSWSKLITAANAAGTSAAAAEASAKNAKTSETNANTSKNAAASSASAADTSKTNAKTSETNAKTSETNSKTSENNAAASASSAAASLAAAQLLTSVPYEAAPYPDVWAPLNDDLRLLAGFAPYDTLTISGQVMELPTKSLTFTRSTTATYIDKSGILQTAAINEPRFERDGLLMEASSTNYFLNSDDPLKWGAFDNRLDRVVIIDGKTQASTLKATTTATAPAAFYINTSNQMALVANEYCTLSARIKGAYGRCELRIRLVSTTVANVYIDFTTGVISTPPSVPELTATAKQDSDGYTYVTATFKVTSDGSYSASIVGATPLGGGIAPVGTDYYVQTIQFEKSAVATSYIPTAGATVTRASDALSLQPSNNIGYRAVGDLINRTTSFELSINAYTPSVGAGYFDLLQVTGVTVDIILRAGSDRLTSFRNSGNISPTINVNYPIDRQLFTQTVDANNKLTAYFGSQSGSRTGAPSSPASTPTLIKFNTTSYMVYHIRNFRIWHRVLTDNQIKGLR